MAKAEDTILWAGRFIVGSAVLFVCGTVMTDHDTIARHDTRLTVLEDRCKTFATKTTRKGWPLNQIFERVEAILPDNDFKIGIE